MGVLLISPEIRKRAAEIAAFCMRPENWYRPGPNATVPGDMPEHVLSVPPWTRVVFSWTLHDRELFRHLSVSNGPSTPTPREAMTIAAWVGFTGGKVAPTSSDDCPVILEPGPDWHLGLNGRVAILVQTVPRSEWPL